MRYHQSHDFLVVVLVFSLVASGCVRESRSITAARASQSNLASAEIEFGEAVHQQILQTVPVYQEAKLNQYVCSVGEKIVAVAERRDLQYRFVILQDERLYATHVPGGYIYLTTGFLEFLQNEIELAALLAHEVGALQYRDPRLSKLKHAFEAVMRAGSLVAPAFGSIGMLTFISLALIGNFVGQEKPLEKQMFDADTKALQYLAHADYDPQGLVDLLRRLANSRLPERPYLYDYLQSHPISGERFEHMDKAFSTLPLENKAFSTGRETYLKFTHDLHTRQTA